MNFDDSDDNDDEGETSITNKDPQQSLLDRIDSLLHKSILHCENNITTTARSKTTSNTNNNDSKIESIVESLKLKKYYEEHGICTFPSEFSIPSDIMRQLTEELIWGQNENVDKSYEMIKVKMSSSNEIIDRRTLTRLENFVSYHDGWHELCYSYLPKIISALLGEEMILYKEKLNIKPPGGSGFAPHLDTPSLRMAFNGGERSDCTDNSKNTDSGPQNFVTVMIAIDDMNAANGCLRVCKGKWDEKNNIDVVPPKLDGDPDSDGRAGAIPALIANRLKFDEIVCRGGSITIIGGFAPHRSSPNLSLFSRRAVFLTYNPLTEGNYHETYYQRMEQIRNRFRENIGLQALNDDEKFEMQALSTIPTK